MATETRARRQATRPEIATSLEHDSRGRIRSSIRTAMREFLAVPAMISAGFVVLAAVSIVLDQANAGWVKAMRGAASHFVGNNAAQSALSAIATGLITVTSITFSVLLLAVQQTASSLSPVVFDQFLRRRLNQVFLGFFVGLALYSYLVLAAVQDKTPPILGATIAVLLTVVALAFLLVLVYSTIDQMRPTNVLSTMREHALAARTREREILRRTRRVSALDDPVKATCYANDAGYVTGIDIDGIARTIHDREDCEVRLHVTVGDFIAHHDAIATVKDGDEEYAKQLAEQLRDAISLARNPDLDRDATTAVIELSNIAWTSVSTAKHNPAIGAEALDAMRDLLAVWQQARKEDEQDPTPPDDQLPIVYNDTDEESVFDSLYSLLVAAMESHQHHTAARVLQTYDAVLPHLSSSGRARVLEDLRRANGVLTAHPPSVQLERALDSLRDSLCDAHEYAAAEQLAQAWDEIAGELREPLGSRMPPISGRPTAHERGAR